MILVKPLRLLGTQQECFLSQHEGLSISTGRPLLPSPNQNQIKFIWFWDSISLSFLVNSGAYDSFIDQDLIKQASIPTEVLSEPKTIQGLNGEILAKVTHRTAPLTLIVFGNHSKRIQLFLIPSSSLFSWHPWGILISPP